MCRIGIAVWVLLVIALAGLPAGVQAQGADDGLVAEWRFDEGSGSVLRDSSGNGNDGVIHGATWVEGKYGGALRFDGVDDYVDCGNDASLDITGAITIEAWIKNNGPSGSDCYDWIVGKEPTDGYQGYALFLQKTGALRIEILANKPTHGNLIGTTNLRSDTWHHVVGTYDDSVMKVYVDGTKEKSANYYSGMTSNNYALYIGRRLFPYPTDYGAFNGIIDEVRIYNRALTADEIKSHYEGQQTALSLTKSASPHSIKQGQTTTITLTITNTGTTAITDIEVLDTIPTDLTFTSGETSKTYTSLRPKDSREFQYILQLNEAGTFNLNPATATYSDEEGNYHTTESKTATITAIPSPDQPATPKSSAEISTASVHLHGEKTDVVLGEDVLLKLSAVNIIGNPLMRVQVIIIPPSGWSVTSSVFAKTGAGQYTTTYDIEEGVGRDIEVRIMPNQIGNDFHVQGRIIYYFGDDSDAREDHTLTLPITVRAEAENGQGAERTSDTSGSEENGSSTPGFAAVVAVAGVLAVYLRRR